MDMSGKSKGDQGEYEFTRAAYDELRDAEKTFPCVFDLYIEMGDQKGVWCLVVTCKDSTGAHALAYIARWSGAWPNAQSQSFAAFLYAACHRTVRMVEMFYDHTREAERERSH